MSAQRRELGALTQRCSPPLLPLHPLVLLVPLSTSSASLLLALLYIRIHDSMALTPGMKLGRESLVDIAIRDASLDEEYVPFGFTLRRA